MVRFGATATFALVAALLATAGVASADTTLATGLPSNVKVSMRGNAIAWSAPTADGRWKLVIRRGGVITGAAVRPAKVPFDVDLGDDGHGRLIATYSRCSRSGGLERPRGCDVYRYDVSTARERRVPGLRNRDDRTGPRSLDLGARGVAIAWVTRGPADPDLGYGAQEARFDPFRGRPRLLARYAQGNISGTEVVGVSATDTGVLWGAQGNGEDGRTRLFLVPRPGESSESRSLTFPIDSMSGTSLDRAVVLSCVRTAPPATACSVVLLGP